MLGVINALNMHTDNEIAILYRGAAILNEMRLAGAECIVDSHNFLPREGWLDELMSLPIVTSNGGACNEYWQSVTGESIFSEHRKIVRLCDALEGLLICLN